MGETPATADFVETGMLGDRAIALLDVETGRVVSAKNPKRWPGMFRIRSEYASPPTVGLALPDVNVTLPDARQFNIGSATAEAQLSVALGRPVILSRGLAGQARVEEFSPDFTRKDSGSVSEFTARPGPFFDAQPVHIVTTASLAKLSAAYPSGRFDPRRFRPNLLVETEEPAAERTWLGRTLSIGSLRLHVERPCGRCVMTTLGQEDLPEDLGILSTAKSLTQGKVGVYAKVTGPGRVRLGDVVELH